MLSAGKNPPLIEALERVLAREVILLVVG